MFNWSVEYLISPGSMTIQVNYYKCKAFTKYGAWKRFLKDTKNKCHYSSRDKLNNFWWMCKYIKIEYKGV